MSPNCLSMLNTISLNNDCDSRMMEQSIVLVPLSHGINLSTVL